MQEFWNPKIKNPALKFRPVTILSTFPKIFGQFIKTYMMKSMDNYFSPHFSACRTSYGMQHALLLLIEERKTNLNKKFVVGAV